MYEKELNSILNASKNNSLTFFVGAGVSRISGAPIWNELIKTICRKINISVKEEYSYEECLKIPQIYYSSLNSKNKNEYFKTIEESINCKDLSPNVVHREMLALNPASFITTNYDELLEDAALNYCQTFIPVACDKDVPNISGNKYILKMHGDFKHKNIVLKEADYLNYSEKFKMIENLLKSIFATNTVVFIGYRLNDYNIKLILNWAKELLKKDFKEPIFFYTDNEELSDLELNYHRSRGILVLDWRKINNRKKDFPDRYLTFFESIKKKDIYKFNGNDEDEAFRALYYMLEPLDKLNALRISDILNRLTVKNLFINGNVLYLSTNNNVLFRKFINIDKMKNEEIETLSKDTYLMFSTIKSVLSKACVYWIGDNNSYYKIKHGEIAFADNHCILFDFIWMENYIKKDFVKVKNNYLKAFYLYKLEKYKESFSLFLEVSKQAFKNKDYILYYFAIINCYNLRMIVEKTNNSSSDSASISDELLVEKDVIKIFYSLPIEFRNIYESLKDINVQTMLFKNAFDAFEAARRLDDAVDNNTKEFGISSCDSAINRVNSYINFLLSNHLVGDIFNEYKVSVKRIMEAIIHKYSEQDKNEILLDSFPGKADKIFLDEIDFYCLVESFKDNELKKLFSKYSIKYLDFKDVNVIENSVKNLIDYYKVVINSESSNIETSIQYKIKKALIILNYVELSQKFVEYICSFLMENEFRYILINDKVSFLDSHIYKRKMFSDKTNKSIEKALLLYFDKHKKAIDEGTDVNIALSTNINVNYCNLANYLITNEKQYISKELSDRVENLIRDNQFQLFSPYYYGHITKNQQKNLVSTIEKQLATDFNIKQFYLLLNYKSKIKKKN